MIIKNGNFIFFFSDRKLNITIQKIIEAYEYKLGPNKLRLSLPEVENEQFLLMFDKYFKKFIDITIYISKKPICENDQEKENHYSIMFKRCKLSSICNEGIYKDNTPSNIDIIFKFDEYEIRY